MLVKQHVHQERELLKWLTLFALAGAIALGVATGVASALDARRDGREPARLPQEIERWSTPMPADHQTPATDAGLNVWRILELQKSERYDEVIVAWTDVDMPCETEVWKRVALGQAYIATGQLDFAAEALDQAGRLRSGNPVVHYFTGLLRLQQAYMADEWDHVRQPGEARYVSYEPPRVVPNTKSMYRLHAALEFEKAIELASTLALDEPLVPASWSSMAALEPTVGDLLIATGASNFEAKAHGTLGCIRLENGSLEQAEYHMDEAASRGASVVYGYQDLGKEYEAVGRHADAARAYMKAVQHDPHKVRPALRAWNSLQKVWDQPW